MKFTPGKRLSEQLHRHRSVHWILLQGTAKVTIDGTEQIVQLNEPIHPGQRPPPAGERGRDLGTPN